MGELGLIDYIRQRAARLPAGAGRELRLGIGDDCAILRPGRGEEIVVTTDWTLEGRHFHRDWHPPASVGHRALARGLSDVAAMGARPVAAFLSLALPRAVAREVAWTEGFFDGLLGLAEQARVPLAGGDTAEAPSDEVLVDIVLLGAVPHGRALRRNGARPGDRLFCTGALGGAAAELQGIAQPGTKRPDTFHVESRTTSEHPQLYPEPRLQTGQALLQRRLVTAAIDVSDGLSTDLRHLCEASGVAAEVQATRLPLHPQAAVLGAEQALSLALNGGEDYELLFTARPGTRVPGRLGGVPLTEIGYIVEKHADAPRVTLVDAKGGRTELAAAGWEHLR